MFFPPIQVHMTLEAVDVDRAQIIHSGKFVCEVSPEPHFYDNPQALRIRVECLAKLKYLQELQTKIAEDAETKQIFEGKDWHLNTKMFIIDVPI